MLYKKRFFQWTSEISFHLVGMLKLHRWYTCMLLSSDPDCHMHVTGCMSGSSTVSSPPPIHTQCIVIQGGEVVTEQQCHMAVALWGAAIHTYFSGLTTHNLPRTPLPKCSLFWHCRQWGTCLGPPCELLDKVKYFPREFPVPNAQLDRQEWGMAIMLHHQQNKFQLESRKAYIHPIPPRFIKVQFTTSPDF